MILTSIHAAQNEGGQLNGGQAWYRTQFYLEEDVSLIDCVCLMEFIILSLYQRSRVLG